MKVVAVSVVVALVAVSAAFAATRPSKRSIGQLDTKLADDAVRCMRAVDRARGVASGGQLSAIAVVARREDRVCGALIRELGTAMGDGAFNRLVRIKVAGAAALHQEADTRQQVRIDKTMLAAELQSAEFNDWRGALDDSVASGVATDELYQAADDLVFHEDATVDALTDLNEARYELRLRPLFARCLPDHYWVLDSDAAESCLLGR